MIIDNIKIILSINNIIIITTLNAITTLSINIYYNLTYVLGGRSMIVMGDSILLPELNQDHGNYEDETVEYNNSNNNHWKLIIITI